MGTWACTACAGANPDGMKFCGHCGVRRSEPEVSEEHLRGVIEGRIGERLAEGDGTIPQERRLITALFADVSGFTALADQLEPEELLEVIDPVIGSLGSVVKQYEGYIEKFAGDALLALFGAPIAHEDDAERALLCALDMHAELARIVGTLPGQPQLTLHVGVNSGHGIGRILGSEARSDYAVLGNSVILAQRLESAAPRGETYVSHFTYELTSHRFSFEPVGELTLKGKAKPVVAWKLVGERAPQLAPAKSQRVLIGRDDELMALTTRLDALVRGGGATVSVLGDAGIGKSRLTHEAKSRADDRHVRWLEARCLSYGDALPYWPYADLLRRFAGIGGDEPAEARAELVRHAFVGCPTVVPYFSRLLGVPRDDDSATRLEPEEFRRRLHASFATWLSHLAEKQPLVLSIEDVHWADSSTLELTAALAALTGRIGVILYLVGRPEAQDAIGEIAPDSLRIELGPLAEPQVDAVLDALLDGGAPRELARIVQHHTGGNPFFVLELVRSLQETGVLVRSNGVWRMRPGWEPTDLPPTIEAVLAARIDLLPLQVADVLHTASVIGRRIRMPLLQAIADETETLDDALHQLSASGFLDRISDNTEVEFVFHHAFVQDVAYGQILRRRRRELHLQVAGAAESLYGAADDTIDLLARHLYLGAAGDRAVPYLVRAGNRAKSLFANDEAIIHLQRALELAPNDAEVELQLADVYELVGGYDEALGHYERVRVDSSDVRAWSGQAATLRKRGEIDKALSTIDEALATPALRQHDLTRLWLEAGRSLSVSGRIDEAIDVLEAGLKTAGATASHVVGLLLVQLARVEGLASRYGDAVRHARDATRIFEQLDDPRGLTTALRVAGVAHYDLHQLDEAASALRRALETADRIGNAEEIAACLVNLGLVEKQRANFDAAITYELDAIDQLERIGHGAGRAQAYANLAQSYEESGRLDEALPYCEKAQQLAAEIGFPLAIADTHNTIACVHLKREEFGEAAAAAEQAIALYLELRATAQAREMLEFAQDAWQRAGDHERARACEAQARGLTSAL